MQVRVLKAVGKTPYVCIGRVFNGRVICDFQKFLNQIFLFPTDPKGWACRYTAPRVRLEQTNQTTFECDL